MRVLAFITGFIFSFILFSCSDKNDTPVQETPLTALVQFQSSIFSGSGNCATCHSNLKDSAGNDVSISEDWRSTMMANSAKDPLWQAKVHSETIRNPSIKDAIEKKCATCHMPMAKVQAEVDNNSIAIFDNGFINSSNSYHKLAMDGVSCTICHQITYDEQDIKKNFTGNFNIDTTTSRPDRKIYGQYDNPLEMPMRMDVGFTPAKGAHIEKSELCATCHTLYTSPVDNPNVKFPEQTPYIEWENSIFGDGQGTDDKSCQQCHMPLADGSVKIASGGGFVNRINPRPDFAKHYFVGGNVYMLTILKNYITELGLTANASNFDNTINRTKYQLENDTVNLVFSKEPALNGTNLEFTLKLENLSGHKFPSGYPARRAWIYVIVKDANGQVVFESGKVNDNGSIVGNDADTDETKYEKHYDVITSPDQVQIYEAIMQDGQGNITYTLLNAHSYKKDNRLTPKGFDKNNVPSDVAVVGDAKNDANFNNGYDEITYKIDTNGYNAPFTVEVKILYQSVGYRFMQDLFKDEPNSVYVQKIKGFYNSVANKGVLLKTISKNNIQ